VNVSPAENAVPDRPGRRPSASARFAPASRSPQSIVAVSVLPFAAVTVVTIFSGA
jgi:hypothetical protein